MLPRVGYCRNRVRFVTSYASILKTFSKRDPVNHFSTYTPTLMNFGQHSDCHQNGLLLGELQQPTCYSTDQYVRNDNSFLNDSE